VLNRDSTNRQFPDIRRLTPTLIPPCIRTCLGTWVGTLPEKHRPQDVPSHPAVPRRPVAVLALARCGPYGLGVPSEPQLSTPRPRDPYWDNAKAVLVTLVVVGHALAPLVTHNVSADILYRWIYAFHMPGFVFVTGILTAELTRRRAARLVTGLLVPYVIFQTIQWLEAGLVDGDLGKLQLLVPRWTLWYLLAALLWRLSTPLWEALKPWVAIVLALVVACVSVLGTGVGQALALDETLGFLPFFVAGLVLRQADIRVRLGGSRAQVLGIATLVGVAVVTTASRGTVSRGVFRHESAHSTGATDLHAALALLVVAGLAVVAVAGLLAALPRGRHWWTAIGEASLYVYLLHAVILVPWRLGTLSHGVDQAWQVALVALGAVALACVLSTRWVRSATSILVEPKWADGLTRRA